MTEIYYLLRNRLQEITELLEVDWYTEQDAQLGDQAQYVETGAYIEFSPILWQTQGQLMQQAALEFDIHLVQDTVLDGEERMTNTALEHLLLVDKIFKKLQGFSGLLSDLPGNSALKGTDDDIVFINSVLRLNSIPQHSLSNLIVTTQRFQCTIIDLGAMPQYQEVLANLNLTVHV